MQTPKFLQDGVLASEEATTVLTPYMSQIAECIYAGHDALLGFRELFPERYAEWCPTTRAAIVHDGMVSHANGLFGGRLPDVAIVPALGSIVIVFADKIAMRFKKLSPCLGTSNIETLQQLSFGQQMMWMDHTHVTAGYRLDATGHEVRDIHIVCRQGDELLWNIELPYRRDDVLPSQTIDGAEIAGPDVIYRRQQLGETGTTAT